VRYGNGLRADRRDGQGVTVEPVLPERGRAPLGPGEIDLEEDRENLLAAARSGRFDIDPALVEETVTDLVPLVTGLTDIVEYGVGPKQLAGYAPKKHSQRMDQPSNASTDLAGVEELVRLGE